MKKAVKDPLEFLNFALILLIAVAVTVITVLLSRKKSVV
jgi:hypothetical protein